MGAQASSDGSVPSRILFLVAGAATGLAISFAGIGGVWAVPVAVAGLVAFGELYLFLTDGERS